MLVSDQLKPGLEALCWAGEDGRDDSSCRVHAVGGSALEPELTLSKKESWTSLGVVLFFVVLKPCPTALLWTRARARRRVGSWDHLSLQFHSLFGFFSPTREGPCGPVWHRCSGTAVPPHQMADDFERGGPSFPPGEGAADLSERGREAREPSPQRSGSSLGGPAGFVPLCFFACLVILFACEVAAGIWGFINKDQFFACLVIMFACEVAAGIWGFINKDQVTEEMKVFYDSAFSSATVPALFGVAGKEEKKAKAEGVLKIFHETSCHSRIDELFTTKLYLIGIAALVVAFIMVSIHADKENFCNSADNRAVQGWKEDSYCIAVSLIPGLLRASLAAAYRQHAQVSVSTRSKTRGGSNCYAMGVVFPSLPYCFSTEAVLTVSVFLLSDLRDDFQHDSVLRNPEQLCLLNLSFRICHRTT
ncbi:UNVERIFIED_CONTAM: hypothetical protein FKN15_033162 [Acipenser sinensis]